MPSSIFLCLFLQIRKQLNKISLISVMRGIFKLNNSWSWHTSFIQNLENHDLFHFYFCDTVPLKACVKVERNGLTTHSMRLTVWEGDWLSPVWYCQETDSAQYDTARSHFWKTQITRQNLNQNLNYFYPLLRTPGRLELWNKQVENLVGLSF